MVESNLGTIQMTRERFSIAVVLLIACVSGLATAGSDERVRELVILYTNDFHSAIDPIPAYWLNERPTPHLGGAAQLMTLVEQIRAEEGKAGRPVFLFDTGDMFTGMLSKLTQGEALMEMMTTLRYDAMAIGNHEFDYGWQNFRRQMFRVPFPVLGANTFYRDTGVPFSRPHVILEKEGVRVGVVGIIGQDARSVVLPSLVEELEFRDPAPAVRASIDEVAPSVDLVVVLAHQGNTGPMQTDAENHPEVQRDFAADIDLSGAVPGIGVFVGGHAHRGIEEPYVHPQTGTVIVQTYGYGTRLGYLRLTIDPATRRVVRHEGRLIKVWSDRLAPDPTMASKMARYKAQVAPQIGEVVGHAAVRLTRSYNTESLLGSFASDAIRERARADIGIMNAGGLRADLPAGPVTRGHILDAFPFLNTVVVLELTGAQIRAVLEQGFTLKRGMIQVSGLVARYDLGRPDGHRLIELSIGGQPARHDRTYRVAVNSFLAEGGDLYSTFQTAKQVDHITSTVAEVAEAYFRASGGPVPPPVLSRLVPSSAPRAGSLPIKAGSARHVDGAGR